MAMTNVDEEVNELYNRVDEIRQQAQPDNGGDEERRPAGGKPRRRLANRAVMLIIGFGMVLYGVIALGGRMVYEGVGTPPPPSVGIVASTQTVSTCEDGLKSLNEIGVSSAQDPSQGLDAEEAEQAADSLLRRYLQFDLNAYPALLSGPALVDIELPDGTKHQAWARLWIPDINPNSEDQTGDDGQIDADNQPGDGSQPDSDNQAESRGVNAHVVYISARTGEPILLIQDLKIKDPLLAGCEETAIHELSENLGNRFQSLPGLIFNIALLGLGLFTLLSWQRGR